MFYFGAKGVQKGVQKPSVQKPSASTVQKHKNGTLFYQSPLFNYLFHHSDGQPINIKISKDQTDYTSSDELVWVFRKNPEQDPTINDNPVPPTTKANLNHIYVKKVPIKVDDKVVNKLTVCTWYENSFRTIRFAGSEQSSTSASSSGQKPIFYIEVYDPETRKATKRLYGDVVYLPTPPNSPKKPNAFGKRNSKNLRKLKADLKLLMRY
jgi:hypothetical protein